MSELKSEHKRDSNEVFLIIANAWQENEPDPANLHILLKPQADEDVIQAALQVLANEGFDEAEITEIGTLTEQPEEEPYLSAYNTALSGQVAMIEFDGSHEMDEDEE